MHQDEFDKILTSLKDNTLKSRHLSGQLLSLSQVEQLAKALKDNTSLTSLLLSVNNLGNEGCQIIVEALKGNTSLNELSLDGNILGDEAGKAIGEMLKTNTSLTRLYLQSNHMGDEAGKVIANALKTNTSLTYLSLGDNGFGNVTGKAISEALKVNTSLNKLNLYGNWLDDEGGKAIVRALKNNTTLMTIYLSGNHIHEKVVDKVNIQTNINTEITKILMKTPFLEPNSINQLHSLLAKKQQCDPTAISLPVPSLKELSLAAFYKNATASEEKKPSVDEKAQKITFKNKSIGLPKELFDPATQALNFKEQKKSWLTLSMFADSKFDHATSKQDEVQTWEIKNKFI